MSDEFFAPGRTELAGNHTDHQKGRVLAAAVDLGIAAQCAPNSENIIRISSKGFRDMIKNILNETIEEGAQSASGQTAQNFGIQQTADENQNILENVGDQTAQGAILGSLTAGVVQAPSVPRVTISQAASALRERAATIQAANEAGSGVSVAYLRAAADVAVDAASHRDFSPR